MFDVKYTFLLIITLMMTWNKNVLCYQDQVGQQTDHTLTDLFQLLWKRPVSSAGVW